MLFGFMKGFLSISFAIFTNFVIWEKSYSITFTREKIFRRKERRGKRDQKERLSFVFVAEGC